MPPEHRVYLCKPERTDALRDELARTFPRASPVRVELGRVDVRIAPDEAARAAALAFASQVLPNVEAIEARSINAAAEAVGVRLIDALDAHAGPWRLHAFSLGALAGGRARLIAEALDRLLLKKRRALRRRQNTDAEGPWRLDEALIQLALASSTQVLLSIAPPHLRHAHRHTLSTFVQGRCAIPRDLRPPSRAYRKLREAEARMHRPIAPDETVVDLGASPGGWSFVALERGARVIAIDRSPLRDDLMQNPKLTFAKADAFSWVPPAPVDWLVCDLIAFPERSLALLDDWLGARRCRHLIVTIKFRGQDDYPRVDAAKALLAQHCARFSVTALDANKNEVTAMGTLKAPPPRAVLFDLDGVLVRSFEAWLHLMSLAGERFGAGPISREAFTPTFGQGSQADVNTFGLSCTPAELDAFFAANFARFAQHVWVNPEAAKVLAALRERGLALSVATNTTTPLAHDNLRAAHLEAAFDTVACADQVPRAKPAPDLLLHACEALGVRPSEAWMVGDSVYDRGSAQAAGVHFVGFGLDGDARVESLAELSALLN